MFTAGMSEFAVSESYAYLSAARGRLGLLLTHSNTHLTPRRL